MHNENLWKLEDKHMDILKQKNVCIFTKPGSLLVVSETSRVWTET